MLDFLLILGLVIVGIIIFVYISFELLKYGLIVNEHKMHAAAPKVTWKYEDMIEIGKLKNDEDMTDEEFDVKYGAFRHEVYRTSLLSMNIIKFLNSVLYYIELYFLYYGEKHLDKLMPHIKQPIFVIGDYRSGTSVLERLIVHHPDVAAFSLTHNYVFKAPKLWDIIVDWLASLRQKEGNLGWYWAGSGIYFPHSSNNLLNRNRAFELERIWESCKQHIMTNRDNNWNTIDDENKNKDNNKNCNVDLLTYKYEDEKFEKLFKNVIKMLLLHKKVDRFINKNPLNGYRLGYLKKIFPDAKFIFIRRNSIQTCESQILMQESMNRCLYIDEKDFRTNNMKPVIPKSWSTDPKYRKHWAFVQQANYPNEHSGIYWMPRVWPRTYPEHLQINQYLKKGKKACAFALGVYQQEKYVIEQINDKNNNFIEGENLLTIYHDDMLQNASLTFDVVLQFLNLKSTKEQRLEWLEKEGFPKGQASTTRTVKMKPINNNTYNNDNHRVFKEETQQVMKILHPCLERYNNRKPLLERVEQWRKIFSTRRE